MLRYNSASKHRESTVYASQDLQALRLEMNALKGNAVTTEEVLALKSHISHLEEENARLRKQIEATRFFSFEELGLHTHLAQISTKSRIDLTDDEVNTAKNVLQDALMFKKSNLFEVAETIVAKMRKLQDSAEWMCYVAPADVDTGLCYNIRRSGSVCFSFGVSYIKYEVRITKLQSVHEQEGIANRHLQIPVSNLKSL